ncbi:acyltransferase family protein [Mangrovimicrobium sediminis]|uniref:Acyltransferase family protein n=1 Tax=Mangrovimicrobium sediminis TaxID=2562682 RepID=A0A4Z0LV72_9GAMM|nr:acyltransferase family protein [Haliea sp. SAOS-164]TGD70955.1 acyltransferase family protein [Haliea sp. SAOS-164]
MTAPISLAARTATSGFLPELEGMRALAVLAVLLFHLGVTGIPGGYLGVDLFFVISGFIISRNLIHDIRGDGLGLGKFYLRRFRRIVPALAVTILCTLAAGWYLLPPAQLADTSLAAAYSLLSVGNFHFWMDAGYFAPAAQSQPLLHTWSLGVEEQFYLFWPALLLLFRRHMLWLVGVLLAASATLSLAMPAEQAHSVFYMLPFRVHQFMAGALVALLVLRVPWGVGAAISLAATCAFLALSAACDEASDPAATALSASAVGLLLVASQGNRLSRAIYANRVMLWIGRRSYALYLVHWPIIVYYQYSRNFVAPDGGEQLTLAAVTLVAGAVLHELVEKPFRYSSARSGAWQQLAAPVTACLVVAGVALAMVWWRGDGYPSRYASQYGNVELAALQGRRERREAIRTGRCNLKEDTDFEDYDRGHCASPVPGERNVLVIGDSLAADTYVMLSVAYPEIHFLQATAGGCGPLLELVEHKYDNCQRLNALRLNELVFQPLDLVVVAALWKEQNLENLVATLAHLQTSGNAIAVFGPRITFPAKVPILLNGARDEPDPNRAVAASADRHPELLQAMREALPVDVPVIDIASIQCPAHCDVILGGELLYIDHHHFSPEGARLMAQRLRASLDLSALMRPPAGQRN